MLTTSVGEGWCVKGIFSNVQLFNPLAAGVVHPVTAGEEMLHHLLLVAASGTWHKAGEGDPHRRGWVARRCAVQQLLTLRTPRGDAKGKQYKPFPGFTPGGEAASPWDAAALATSLVFGCCLSLGVASGSARQGSTSQG